MVNFLVRYKNKKIKDSVLKMPILEQKKFHNLVDDLEQDGPVQKS
jgi:hypothetical protein